MPLSLPLTPHSPCVDPVQLQWILRFAVECKGSVAVAQRSVHLPACCEARCAVGQHALVSRPVVQVPAWGMGGRGVCVGVVYGGGRRWVQLGAKTGVCRVHCMRQDPLSTSGNKTTSAGIAALHGHRPPHGVLGASRAAISGCSPYRNIQSTPKQYSKHAQTIFKACSNNIQSTLKQYSKHAQTTPNQLYSEVHCENDFRLTMQGRQGSMACVQLHAMLPMLPCSCSRTWYTASTPPRAPRPSPGSRPSA